VVLGGGPAGAATALRLVRNGYSVVLVERSDYASSRVGETLPPAIQPLLGQLGVWEPFMEQKPAPSFGIRSAWGGPELRTNDFIFSAYGSGWCVARNRFDALLAHCAGAVGVQVYSGADVQIVKKVGIWRVDVSAANGSRRRFRAGFVVDATGRRAAFARKQGSRRILLDSLIGASAVLPSRDYLSSGYILIEAVENGWWYSAVLPDSRLIVVYMTDGDIYGNARDHGSGANIERTTYTRLRMDSLDLMRSQTRLTAANTSWLDRVAGPDWLAVGDAAMAFDPLSGQGIYKAIQWGIRAADAIRCRRGSTDDATPFRDYVASLSGDLASYLRLRHQFYELEKRWRCSTFWRRRHRSSSELLSGLGEAVQKERLFSPFLN
jgi:flavin-dependent dehydrogenase